MMQYSDEKQHRIESFIWPTIPKYSHNFREVKEVTPAGSHTQ